MDIEYQPLVMSNAASTSLPVEADPFSGQSFKAMLDKPDPGPSSQTSSEKRHRSKSRGRVRGGRKNRSKRNGKEREDEEADDQPPTTTNDRQAPSSIPSEEVQGALMAAVYQAYYATPDEALVFDGEDVSEFLKKIEKRFQRFYVKEDNRLEELLSRCVGKTKKEVTRLTYGMRWKEAKDALRNHYFADDDDQKLTPEDRLKAFNTTTPGGTYKEVSDWLMEHRYLTAKAGKRLINDTTQSRAIWAALPAMIRLEVKERNGIQEKDIAEMKYDDLRAIILRWVEPRLRANEEDKARSDQPKTTKETPKKATRLTLKTQERSAEVIDDLTKQIRELRICYDGLIQKKMGLSNSKRPNFSGTTSIINVQNHGEDSDTESLSINAMGYDMKCWYCFEDGPGKGHFPDTCPMLLSDKAKGFAFYNSYEGNLYIGPGRTYLVPPKLLFTYQGKKPIRRLARAWALAFPDSEAAEVAKRIEKADHPVYRVTDEDRRVIEAIMPRLNYGYAFPMPKLPTHEEGMKTVSLTFDDDDEGPTPDVMTHNVSIVEKPRKRSRTNEDLPDDTSPKEEVIKEKNSSGKDTLPMNAKAYSERMASELLSKKLNVTVGELMQLLPLFARKVAEKATDVAEGTDTIATAPTPVGRHDGGSAGMNVNAIQDFLRDQPDLEAGFESLEKGLFVNAFTVEPQTAGAGNVPDKFPAARQELPFCYVKINDPSKPAVEALIDSGAEGNIMNIKVAEHFGLKITERRSFSTAYSNNRVEIIGTAWVRLYIANCYIEQIIYVTRADVSLPCILGMPFIRGARLTFDHSPEDGSMLAHARFGSSRLTWVVAGPMRWTSAHQRSQEYNQAPVKVNSIVLSEPAARRLIVAKDCYEEGDVVVQIAEDEVDGVIDAMRCIGSDEPRSTAPIEGMTEEESE